MSTPLVIWTALGGAIALVWLVRLVAFGVALRGRRLLKSDGCVATIADRPRISVLVAARNEEAHIETCVTTLLDQDYGDLELIVVDDRSDDRTPEILSRMEKASQDGDARPLCVLTVTSVPAGWLGKNNAMRQGVSAATGEWLLFTDADCRFTSPSAVSIALTEALEQKIDFLTIIPGLDVRTVWERILQPVCALVLMVWFQPTRVNDPKRSTAYANGAFMLMRRACYEAIGGHERVRGAINEDIQFARLTKERGLRLCVYENEGLYQTRMYDTVGEAWSGWSRIFSGSLGTVGRTAIAALLVLTFSIGPWLGVALTALMMDGEARLTALWVWIGAATVMQIVAWRLYGAIGFGRGWSLTYVLGAAATFAVLINATLKTSGMTTITWRNTTYRRSKRCGTGVGRDLSESQDPVFCTERPSPPAGAPFFAKRGVGD